MARILVIEDDANVRAFLDDVLRAAGHAVAVTSDGRAGLSYYEQHRPDLVITDIFMPQRDGLDVVLQLAAKVRIIAISGGGDVDELDHLDDAVQFGAWTSLSKPFTAEALLKAVREALAADG